MYGSRKVNKFEMYRKGLKQKTPRIKKWRVNLDNDPLYPGPTGFETCQA